MTVYVLIRTTEYTWESDSKDILGVALSKEGAAAWVSENDKNNNNYRVYYDYEKFEALN